MDKRKNNGGNSTKAKGIDKRKNEYKNILNDALTINELTGVVKMLHKKAVNDLDVPAAKIILEYYLGKPVQTIDQNTSLNINDFDLSKLYNKKT